MTRHGKIPQAYTLTRRGFISGAMLLGAAGTAFRLEGTPLCVGGSITCL
jgi:hypothetical protein